MRTSLIILFVFVIKFSGLSQSTEFFKTYDLGSDAYPVLGHLLENGSKIYSNGTISDPNQKIIIIKANQSGFLTDTNIIGTDTVNYYPNNFLQISNNKLLILGNFANTSTSSDVQYMLFIDTNLFKVSDSIYSNILSIFWGGEKINKCYYFGGNTKYNNNGDSLSFYNVLFWKTDSNFNKVTSNSIGLENIHEGCRCIKSGFDNNLLLGGLTLKNSNTHDWYLVNVDTNGTVIGEYYFGNPMKPDADGLISISLSTDSSYILTGLKYRYDFGAGNYYYAASVVKLDRNFNTIWEKQFGKTAQGITVNKVIITNDGNQVMLAQRSPYNSIWTIFSQLAKFNNDGNILWSRDYLQGDTIQYLRYRAWDVIETSDKGFAFCGSAKDTTNVGPYQQAWLVKTDSLGCDGLRSCNDTAMVVEILNHPDTLCKDSTYQIAVRLKGRSAPYRLYVNSTLALDSIYYPYTLPLWIDTILPVVLHDTGWQNLSVTLHEPWERTASDTVQIYVRNCSTTASLTEYYKQKVDIFPNPATTELHVNIRGLIEGTYTITMYDIQGKTVDIITTKEQVTVIDISKYKQGVYWVRVLGNNIVKSEKVIKLKND